LAAKKGFAVLKRPVVSIVRVGKGDDESVRAGLSALLESLGGLESIVPPGTKRVLVKPNLMMGKPWDTGITVHPALIEQLVIEIRKLGVPVIVGEGAGWGCKSDDAFRATGVDVLCRRLGVPLVDFKRGKGVRVPVPGGTELKDVLVDEVVPGCDFIISLAKMKTHCETIVSLSLKNMKGLITEDKERLRFHLLNVNRCLIDLNRVFRPHLAVVEGIVALEGIGPLLPGKPKPLGLLVGGADPLSVDAVCARIMRIDPKSVRHLAYAAEAGIGRIDERDIEIVGESVKSVRPDSYEYPPRSLEGLSPSERIKIVDGNPCSNCIASIASYLHGYIDRNIIEQATHTVEILIGGKARSRGKGNEVAMGNCLKRFEGEIPFVSGCPPPSDAYLELIARALKGNFRPSTVNAEGKVVDLSGPSA
jgi:uncharacterized protein (DUF362 family)